MLQILLIDGDYSSGQRFRQILSEWHPEQCALTVEHMDISGKQLLRQLKPDVLLLHDNTRYIAPEEIISAAVAGNRDIKIVLIADDVSAWCSRGLPNVVGVIGCGADRESVFAQMDALSAPESGAERRQAADGQDAGQLMRLAQPLEAAKQACYLLRVFPLADGPVRADLQATERIIADGFGDYQAGWIRESGGGLCMLIRDIGEENMLCSMQILWQMMQDMLSQMNEENIFGTSAYALVSERVSPAELAGQYKKLLTDERDFYFCRKTTILSDAYLEAKRKKVGRDALDSLTAELYPAIFAGDEVRATRLLESLYLRQLKPAFDWAAVTYVREALSDVYRTLAAVLHSFELEEERQPSFRFLEEELSWQVRRFAGMAANGCSGALRPKTVEVLRYIAQNYTGPISLNSIADSLGITNTYISKIFKEDMGVGVVDFVNRTRISRALYLMRTDEKKLYEIAREVGFEDPKYFGRVFKAFTGHTPSEHNNAGGKAHEGGQAQGQQQSAGHGHPGA